MKKASQRFMTMIAAVIMLQGMIPHCTGYALPNAGARALTLPDARIGQAYEYQFKSVGGRPPFRWAVVEGDLPPGIKLSPNGKLRGTPAVPSTEPVSFIVEVTDSSVPPEYSERTVLLMVRPRPLSIEDDSPRMQITGDDEQEANKDSGSPRQTASRRPPVDAQDDRDRSPRQARHLSSRQRPQTQEEDMEDDARAEEEAASLNRRARNVQRGRRNNRIDEAGHTTPKIDGAYQEGDTTLRVIADPRTRVVVMVGDKPWGYGVTRRDGTAVVSLKAPLPADPDVEVKEDLVPTMPPPNIKTPLREGDKTITGTATPNEKVAVRVNDKPPTEVLAGSNGSFEVQATLARGDKITARQNGSGESLPIIVGPPLPPEIIGPLHPGDLTILGKGLPKAKIKIVVGGVDLSPVDVADDGSFTVKLTRPLRALEVVKLQQNGSADAVLAVLDIPDSNWGRVRAYFYGGAVLSNRNRNSSDTSGNDFTKVDLGVGFTLDKNYIMNASGTFFINTYFDTRLTAIPVAAMMTPTTTTPTPMGARRTASVISPLAEPTADQFQTFLSSKKAGIAQAGLYMPIAITAWNFGSDPNRLFIAPLAKAGIQTITSGLTSAEGMRLGEDDVYNFFAGGLRLGHYKLKYKNDLALGLDTNVGPELVSWLDLTYGKWENFEILTPRPNLIRPPDGPAVVLVRQRPWRVSAEGRLKVPETPFMVGFDGNFGQGPDDLRFLFGMRFDIGKALSKLKLLEKLGLDK